METKPRPTTRTISKTPSIPQLRWPVSEHFQLQSARSPRDDCRLCHTVLAATNKYLARSNKSRTRAKATKKRQIRQPGLIRQTCHVLAATNKSLAQINKCWNMGKATKTIASATCIGSDEQMFGAKQQVLHGASATKKRSIEGRLTHPTNARSDQCGKSRSGDRLPASFYSLPSQATRPKSPSNQSSETRRSSTARASRSGVRPQR